MAKARHILRKVQPASSSTLETSHLPVTLALVVLSAFLAGVSLAYQRFDDARWWANAWTSLVFIPFLLAALVAVSWLGAKRWVKRTMQLGVIASLLAHIAFMIAARETDIFGKLMVRVPERTKLTPARRRRAAPQYHPSQLMPKDEQTPQDFEIPVPTETPEEELPQAIEKVADSATNRREPTKPAEEPIPSKMDRSQAQRPATRESAPEVTVARSEGSPRASRMAPAPSTSSPQDSQPSESRAGESTPSAQAANVARRSESTSPTARMSEAPQSQSQKRLESQTAKAEAAPGRAPEVAMTAPTVNRSAAASAGGAIRASAEPSTPSPISERASMLAARKFESTKSTPESPATGPRASDFAISPSQQSGPVVKAESAAKQEPTLAQAEASISDRKSRITTRPAISASVADAGSPKAAIEDSSPGLTAQATNTTRQSKSETIAKMAPADQTTESVASVAPAPARAKKGSASPNPVEKTEVAKSVTPRRSNTRTEANVTTRIAEVATNSSPQTSETPDPLATGRMTPVERLAATSSPGGTVSRELTVPDFAPSLNTSSQKAANSSNETPLASLADRTSTPGQTRKGASRPQASSGSIAAPSARPSETGSENELAQAPAAMALNRGVVGSAGAGQSMNLDRGMGAGDRPAATPSVSARRAESTSSLDAKRSTLNPSSVASVARSKAERDLPSASQPIQNPEMADQGGAAEIAELSASSSASELASGGRAKQGDVTAAKGSADIDVGPNLLVAESGASRAAGGGQPTLSMAPSLESDVIRRSSGSASGGAMKGAPLEGSVEGIAGGAGDGETPTVATPTVSSEVSRVVGSAQGGGQPRSPSGGLGAPGIDPVATSAVRSAEPRSHKDLSDGALSTSGVGVPDAPTTAPAQPSRSTSPTGSIGLGAVSQVDTSGEESNFVGPTDAQLEADKSSGVTGLQKSNGGGGGKRLASALTGDETGPQATGALTGGRASRTELVDGVAGPISIGGGTEGERRSPRGSVAPAPNLAEMIGGTPASEAGQELSPTAATMAGGRTSQSTSIGASSRPTSGVEGVPESVSIAASPGISRKSSVATSGGGAESGPDVGVTGATVARRDAGRDGRLEQAIAGSSIAEGVDSEMMSAVAQADEDHGIASASMRVGRGKLGSKGDEPSARSTSIRRRGEGADAGETGTQRITVATLARTEGTSELAPLNRFRTSAIGGEARPTMGEAAPTASFARRIERRNQSATRGSPQTERAIELGLSFLARRQLPDGNWSLQGFEEETSLASDTAATALAILAFQGAGYHHVDREYRDNLRAAIDYLLRNQKEDGDLFLPLDDDSNRSVWLYSHGFATLALCEAYGMTQDPELKVPAQKALDFIVRAQHRERGGWRYSPGVGSDTSVTATMIVALKSGELAGLNVPANAYAGAVHWLDLAQDPNSPHLYRYNPFAADTVAQRHGRSPTTQVTALGLLMRLYLGWKPDHPAMVQGAEKLKENLPGLGATTNSLRDTYYWYYATQVMYHMGGDYRKAWNEKLRTLLYETQEKEGSLAGSWNPRTPTPDRWGPHGGRIFVTTLNLLSLEVDYRYLPVYDEVGK